MDREEILRRRRAEEDESSIFVEKRHLDVTECCVLFIVLLLFNIITGRSSSGPCALFWSLVALASWSKYRASRKRGNLLMLAASVIALAVNIFLFWMR